MNYFSTERSNARIVLARAQKNNKEIIDADVYTAIDLIYLATKDRIKNGINYKKRLYHVLFSRYGSVEV